MNPRLIYLSQTDTTIGLLSQDGQQLAAIKKRDSKKPFIKAFASLSELKNELRIDKQHKKIVRRSRKITFVPRKYNIAFRQINDFSHKEFVKKFEWVFTTSANEASKEFCLEFAVQNCDVLVLNKSEYKPKKSSSILKLYKRKMKSLRG